MTGDCSRGAAGFRVEHGRIAHPVEGITIAGNLRDMFTGVEAMGAVVNLRSSFLIDSRGQDDDCG